MLSPKEGMCAVPVDAHHHGTRSKFIFPSSSSATVFRSNGSSGLDGRVERPVLFQIAIPLKETSMNHILASAQSITTTAAAVLAVAAMASGPAYADDITVDNTPFVSSRIRAEVQAEVMGQSEALRTASSEWATQSSPAIQSDTAFTRAQAKADYIASRSEVKALTGEDSGSSYLAKLPRRMSSGVVAAKGDQ